MAGLDLSSLDVDLNDLGAGAAQGGTALDVPISQIAEDENQPRGEFDQDTLKELADSIKEHGILQPIVVRSAGNDTYVIIMGARRFRAAQIAGLTSIPVMVKDDVTDTNLSYVQVVENAQRENLKPFEMANFIDKQMKAGEKQADIAKKIGKNKVFVSRHAALIDAPGFIRKVYDTGKCTSAQDLYELTKLAKKYLEEVEDWCETTEEITRGAIKDFSDILTGKKVPTIQTHAEPGENGSSSPASVEAALDRIPQENDDDYGTSQSEGVSYNEEDVTHLPFHNPDLEEEEKDEKGPKIFDPTKYRKPVVLVEYKGRAAMLDMTTKAEQAMLGFVIIKYEDGTGEEEVNGSDLKINMIIDGR